MTNDNSTPNKQSQKRTRRKNFQPAEKVAILKKHLLEDAEISDLCDEFNIQPSQFYQWQKEFFENGTAAFDKKQKKRKDPNKLKVDQLEQQIVQKNEVIAELMQEHVQLKKHLGEL